MWVHLILLFLAGTALANPLIWKEGYEYQYLVRSRAFAGVSKLSPQLSGVVIKGLLQIRVMKPNTLIVQFSGAKYAPVHTELQRDWDDPVPDQKLNYIDLPRGNPYLIILDSGNTQQVYANPEEPVWQVNMMKGILSHLQLNADQGQQNLIGSVAEGNDVFQTYTVKEQSVTGHCNITYDIMPVSQNKERNINVVPIPQLEGDKLLDIMKIRDYKYCTQLPIYQFAMTKEQEENLQHTYLTRSTKTDMIVSHNTEHCTIRSSVMKNTIQVRPNLNDMENSDVSTIMNLTLVDMKLTAQENREVPRNVVSVGNLTYIYSKNPFSLFEHVPLDLGLDSKSGQNAEADSQEKATSSWNSEVRERNTRPLRIRRTLWADRESHDQSFGYLIHKPTLQKGISLLAMGLAGDSRQMVDKADLITRANRLIHEITTEIVKHDKILEQNTLEKFTIVTNILRQLNPEEIATVENNRKSLRCLKVFRDALAQAGTGPAFLNIRESILTGKVKGLEAADLISRLPRTVREPTVEYIEAFFQLITTPEVKNQQFLNTTAHFAFAELVRYVMVWNQQYFYPVRAFGTLIKDEDKKKLTDTYIPYLANELKKAYDARENNKIVTYTVTLGNLAHKQIISVFEPYLEGKYNVTKFQRMMMVGALKRLSDVKPELVRPIVYKIYQNDLENYEVRVAAVQVLLNSRPPLQMLQRIAEKTNHEIDPDVNNAVVTGIISLAELQLKKYRDVARNALLVKPLLNPNVVPNNKYSVNIMQDYMNEQKDMSAWFIKNTLANKNTILPNILKLRMGTNSSNLTPPDFNVLYATTDVSVIEQMIKKLFLPTAEDLPKRSLVDDLSRKLNILLDQDEAIEGCAVLNSRYGVYLITFDQDTLKNMLYDILGTKRTVNQPINVDFTSIASWETIIVYPSEIGLLVNYNLNSPLLTSLNTKVLTKSLLNPPDLKVHIETDLVASQKVMSRLSFITPFDDQRYASGMDINDYVHVPAIVDLHIDQKAVALNIVYEPLPGTTGTKLLHRSVVPFTLTTEAVTFTPVLAQHRTQQLRVGTLRKENTKMGPLVLTNEEYTSWPNRSYHYTPPRHDNFFQLLMTSIMKSVNHPKLEVMSRYKASDDKKINISAYYDYSSGMVSYDGMLERPEKLNKLLKEVQYNVENKEIGPVSILNGAVNFKVPSQNLNYHCDVGLLNMQQLFISVLFSDCDLRLSSDSVLKICGTLDVYRPPSACPTLDVPNLPTETMYNGMLRYGESCDIGGKEMHIEVHQKQSEQVKEAIMISEEYQQCRKDMEKGNLGTANCRKVCKYIDIKDELSLKLEADQMLHETVYYYTIKMLLNNMLVDDVKVQLMESKLMDSKLMESKIEKNTEQKLNEMNLKMKIPLNSELINVTLSASPLIFQASLDSSKLPLAIKQRMYMTMDVKEMISCTLGKTKVLTFDGLEYPIDKMQCPHVLMISPKLLEREWSIASYLTPKQANVAVLAKDLDNGQRQLIIVIDGEMHTLEISNNNRQIILDERPVNFRGDSGLISGLLGENLNILELPFKVYKISIKSVGVYIYFNGQRVQLEVDDKYNGLVRGVCGNKDNIKENDLMVPQGCVTKDPQHMIALYASVTDKCPPVVLQKLQEAERAECIKEEHQQTNVVSDLDAGRINPYSIWMTKLPNACTLLKTDIISGTESICFSLRPLVVCGPKCISDNTILKTISYFCEPINDETLELKRRIENGANPNFTQKSVSFWKELEIPINCHSVNN